MPVSAASDLVIRSTTSIYFERPNQPKDHKAFPGLSG
jgi:hypothetical protein